MLTSDAIEFFGSVTETAKAAEVSSQAVSQWKDLVPPLSASRLAIASKGKLKYDPNLYASWNNRTQKIAS